MTAVKAAVSRALFGVALAALLTANGCEVNCDEIAGPISKCICQSVGGGTDPCAAIPACYADHGLKLKGFRCGKSSSGSTKIKISAADALKTPAPGVGAGAASAEFQFDGGEGYAISWDDVTKIKALIGDVSVPLEDFYVAVGAPSNSNVRFELQDIRYTLGGGPVAPDHDAELEQALEEANPGLDVFAMRMSCPPPASLAGYLTFDIIPLVRDPAGDVPDYENVTLFFDLVDDLDDDFTFFLPVKPEGFDDSVYAAPLIPEAAVAANDGAVPESLLIENGTLHVAEVLLVNRTSQAVRVDVGAILSDGSAVIATEWVDTNVLVPADSYLRHPVDLSLGSDLAAGHAYEVRMEAFDADSGHRFGTTEGSAEAAHDPATAQLLVLKQATDSGYGLEFALYGAGAGGGGASLAGDRYFILCSVKGVGTGTPLGPAKTLPLLLDPVTIRMLGLPASNPLFDGWTGTLDASASGHATFAEQPLLDATATYGPFTITFAALIVDSATGKIERTSNAVLWSSH